MTGHLVEFIALTEKAEAIQSSEAAPEIIFDLIFSEDISKRIAALGLSPDYYDPDTTYEEDVAAYVTALREKADEYQKVVDALTLTD